MATIEYIIMDEEGNIINLSKTQKPQSTPVTHH